MRDACEIRAAEEGDVQQIVTLVVQLGYTVDAAHVHAVLESHDRNATIFVAVRGKHVVGIVDVGSEPAMIALPAHAFVNALVVAENERGHGTGALLLRQAEAWARKHGFTSIFVRSNVIRDRAHRFYAREGYERFKAQAIFEKRL